MNIYYDIYMCLFDTVNQLVTKIKHIVSTSDSLKIKRYLK